MLYAMYWQSSTKGDSPLRASLPISKPNWDRMRHWVMCLPISVVQSSTTVATTVMCVKAALRPKGAGDTHVRFPIGDRRRR